MANFDSFHAFRIKMSNYIAFLALIFALMAIVEINAVAVGQKVGGAFGKLYFWFIMLQVDGIHLDPQIVIVFLAVGWSS